MNADGEATAVEVRRRVYRLLLLLLPVVLGSACDSGGGPGLNPNYKEPTVWGILSKDFTLGELTYDKEIGVIDFDGLRMAPIVLLNGSQVELLSYSAFEYDYGDTNVIPAYQKYELEVQHYWGTGFCHVVMPGDFHLTAPPARYTLGQESTLVSTWRQSRGAQWYWLSIDLNYDYYDTAGVWDNYELRLDTLVHDSSIALPPDRVFPPFVKEALLGEASVTVLAGYGPANQPGDLGNVRGNAVGFVNAVNVPPERYFYVVSPPAVRRAPDGRAALEQFKARLRSRVPGR